MTGTPGPNHGSPERPGAGEFDGELYGAHTGHHRAHDDHVLTPAGLRPGLRVLDLGCGAGDLTLTIARLVGADDAQAPAGGSVVAVDPSTGCVDRTRTTLAAGLGSGARVEVLRGRAQDLPELLPAGEVDVVVSVAALHWVPCREQAAALRGIRHVLRPGGRLRADLGGAGQIEAVRSWLDPLAIDVGGAAGRWCFPTAQSYRQALRAAGFDQVRVELLRQRRPFADAEAAVGWLRSQVLPGYLASIERDAREDFVSRACDLLVRRGRREDGSYDQDYVRLDVLAIAGV